jgi:hypothetical protein
VLYFAGHGGIDARGEPGWILHDAFAGGNAAAIRLADIKAVLRQSKARAKVLLIDASFALPDGGR